MTDARLIYPQFRATVVHMQAVRAHRAHLSECPWCQLMYCCGDELLLLEAIEAARRTQRRAARRVSVARYVRRAREMSAMRLDA